MSGANRAAGSRTGAGAGSAASEPRRPDAGGAAPTKADSPLTVLLTGASGGIGAATTRYFLDRGHTVHGLDIAPAPDGLIEKISVAFESGASDLLPANAPASVSTDAPVSCSTATAGITADAPAGTYLHHIADVRDPATFPVFSPDAMPQILISCAGVQDTPDDIEVNLKGAINIAEHFAIGNDRLQAVVNVGSASGHTGSEFPAYAASKGGLMAYTKNLALRLAPQATCNSIDPGGVLTDLNRPVMEDASLWAQIMELTPLKRWAAPEEIAEWIYFVAVRNRFMTGQNLLIDGGEAGYNHFIWPE